MARAAILGLGARGHRWAEACRQAGWEVAGFDPGDRAGARLAKDAVWRRETTISATVKGADWVICCLPERLELMRTVIQRAQAAAPEEAVIAVASRVFDIEAVQGCAIRPTQVVRVSESEDGGVALDVSSRNQADLRISATQTLAGLTAAMSLAPSEADQRQPAKKRKKA